VETLTPAPNTEAIMIKKRIPFTQVWARDKREYQYLKRKPTKAEKRRMMRMNICIRCGGKALLHSGDTNAMMRTCFFGDGFFHWVECKTCHARTKRGYDVSVVKMWNEGRLLPMVEY
jgi:hypothetical protein